MIDVWMGDDFFHNGAFRQSYGYDYVMGLESSKEDTEVELRQGQGRQTSRRFRLFSRARLVCRGREKIRLQDCCLPGSSSSSIPLMTLSGPRVAWRIISTPLPFPRSPWAATTTRKTCTARKRSTATLEPHDTNHRTFWCWVHGVTAHGARRRAIWEISTTQSLSAKEFRARSKQDSLRTI